MEAIDNKNAALEKAAEEQRSAASTPEPSQDTDSDTQYVLLLKSRNLHIVTFFTALAS